MKILICSESYYPNISGVAVFSHNLAKKMVERGHTVRVIAPSPKYTGYIEILDGVKIHRVPSKKNKYREGYFISKSPFKKVAQIIDEFRPDAIHLQDPVAISLAGLRNAKKLKIPVVVTNHFSLEYIVSYLSPFFKIFKPIILFAIARYLNWFYNQCQVLTCPTQTIAKGFRGPITKVKLKVISNGVDLSRFMPRYGDSATIRRQFKIPPKKSLILYVGRLDVDKNVDILIKAVPGVIKNSHSHFVILGSGKEKKNLERLAKALEIKNNITFIDFIPYQDRLLPKIYQTSFLFVNTCPAETQSLVTLEAKATGLPVVLANSGALPELVEDFVDGFKFRVNDEKDLADKILKILQNPKLAQRMGEKGIESVEKHMVERTYNEFEKIYKEVSKS